MATRFLKKHYHFIMELCRIVEKVVLLLCSENYSKCPKRHKFPLLAPLLKILKQFKSRLLTYIWFIRFITASHWSVLLQDIKQNPWTGKYRSLTYMYFMRSIFVSHWSIIQSMTVFHQTVFNLLIKVTGPWKIGQWPTYILEVNVRVTLIHYHKYYIPPLNSLKDI